MNRIISAVGSIAIAAIVAAAGIGPASAAEPDVSTEVQLTDAQVLAGARSLGDDASASATPTMLPPTAQASLARDLVSRAAPHEGATPEFSSAAAFDVPTVGIVVSVPIWGDFAGHGSALVGTFDADREFQSSVELQFLLSQDGGGTVRTWTDTGESRSVSVSSAQVDLVKEQAGLGEEAEVGTNGFVDEMQACLASKGVPWALIALVGGLCMVACGVTFGAACAVCVASYFTGWGATITKCTIEVNQGLWR